VPVPLSARTAAPARPRPSVPVPASARAAAPARLLRLQQRAATRQRTSTRHLATAQVLPPSPHRSAALRPPLPRPRRPWLATPTPIEAQPRRIRARVLTLSGVRPSSTRRSMPSCRCQPSAARPPSCQKSCDRRRCQPGHLRTWSRPGHPLVSRCQGKRPAAPLHPALAVLCRAVMALAVLALAAGRLGRAALGRAALEADRERAEVVGEPFIGAASRGHHPDAGG
jgi:hypothetical protein